MNQGDLGWIEERSFSNDVISFIKDLKKEELSKPLIRGRTVTLFKLVDKRKSPIKNVDKNSMRNNLINKKKMNNLSCILIVTCLNLKTTA